MCVTGRYSEAATWGQLEDTGKSQKDDNACGNSLGVSCLPKELHLSRSSSKELVRDSG